MTRISCGRVRGSNARVTFSSVARMFSLSLYAGMMIDKDRAVALEGAGIEGTVYFSATASMLPPPALVFRLMAGVLVGAAAWPALHAVMPRLPELIRFLLGYWLFTFGPGLALSGRLTRDLDPLVR